MTPFAVDPWWYEQYWLRARPEQPSLRDLTAGVWRRVRDLRGTSAPQPAAPRRARVLA